MSNLSQVSTKSAHSCDFDCEEYLATAAVQVKPPPVVEKHHSGSDLSTESGSGGSGQLGSDVSTETGTNSTTNTAFSGQTFDSFTEQSKLDPLISIAIETRDRMYELGDILLFSHIAVSH